MNQTDVLSKVHQSQVSFLRRKMRENMIEINDEDVGAIPTMKMAIPAMKMAIPTMKMGRPRMLAGRIGSDAVWAMWG